MTTFASLRTPHEKSAGLPPDALDTDCLFAETLQLHAHAYGALQCTLIGPMRPFSGATFPNNSEAVL